MTNKRDPNKVAVTFWIKRDLRDAAATKAADRGTTVTDVIRTYLEGWVKRP